MWAALRNDLRELVDETTGAIQGIQQQPPSNNNETTEQQDANTNISTNNELNESQLTNESYNSIGEEMYLDDYGLMVSTRYESTGVISNARDEVMRLENLESTYVTPLLCDTNENDINADGLVYCASIASEKAAFEAGFNVDDYTETIDNLLKTNKIVKKYFESLVPTEVSYDQFWCRYFFRCNEEHVEMQWDAERQLKAAKRKELIDRGVSSIRNFVGNAINVVAPQEILRSDDEDDDDGGGEEIDFGDGELIHDGYDDDDLAEVLQMKDEEIAKLKAMVSSLSLQLPSSPSSDTQQKKPVLSSNTDYIVKDETPINEDQSGNDYSINIVTKEQEDDDDDEPQKQVMNLNFIVEKKNSLINELQETVQQKEAKLQLLEEQVQYLSADNEALKKSMEDLTSSLEVLQSQIGKKNDTEDKKTSVLNELQHALEDKDKKIRRLDEDISSLTAENATMKKSMDASATSLARLKTELDVLKEDNLRLVNELKNKDNMVSSAGSSLESAVKIPTPVSLDAPPESKNTTTGDGGPACGNDEGDDDGWGDSWGDDEDD